MDQINSLLRLFDDDSPAIDEKNRDELLSPTTTPCGDVFYPSSDLANRILKFSDDSSNILRSTDSDISVQLTFVNNTNHALYLFWINFDGGIRTPGSKVKPAKEHRVNSFLSHPFIISFSSTVDDLKDVLGIYIPRNRNHSKHRISVDTDRINSQPGKPDKVKKMTRACYEKTVVCGFTVYFEIGLMEKYAALVHVLREDLTKINECVPPAALSVIRSTAIWLNDDYRYTNYQMRDKDGMEYVKDIHRPPESMCFHPSADWLEQHGNLSHKAECVEIYRVRDYIKERGYMPMVLLHELGHSFHWYLDFEREDVLRAYQSAKETSGLYRNIPFILGGRRDAYALTNQMEYFSELTECLFGLNDFYPFNRRELMDYDPTGYKVVLSVWSMNEPQIFEDHQKALKRRARSKEEQSQNESKRRKSKLIERLVVDEKRIVAL